MTTFGARLAKVLTDFSDEETVDDAHRDLLLKLADNAAAADISLSAVSRAEIEYVLRDSEAAVRDAFPAGAAIHARLAQVRCDLLEDIQMMDGKFRR